MIITRLQTSLQKHHKTLLACLLVVIIASFVFYVGPTGHGGGRETAYLHRGVNLADERDSRQARDLASLTAALFNQALHTDELLLAARRAAIQRGADRPAEGLREFQFLVGVADKLADADALGIPTPSEAQMREFITGHPLFANNTGTFDPTRLKNFTEFARARIGLDETRLQRALANSWRVRKLDTLSNPASAPALSVLATRISEKLRSRWTVETATFRRADYAEQVAADEKAIAAHFEANKERYRVPEKIRLRVARIAGDTAAAAALPAPADAELLSLIKERPDLFPAAISDGEAFLKANRDAVATAWRAERAGAAAAAELSEKLDAAFPPAESRPENAKLDTLLKQAGLTVAKLPAYSADALPAGTGVPEALLPGALSLSAANWRTGAIPYGKEAFVFIYDESIPSRLPELAEVRERVGADWAAAETDRRFAESASRKAAEIAAAVKAGKSFADAARDAGLKPAPAVNFVRRECPPELARHIVSLDPLPIGGTSSALPSGPDRIVARIITRLGPDPVKDDPLAREITEELGRTAASITAGGAREIAE